MKLKYVKVAMFILIATILSTCLVMVSINTEHKQIEYIEIPENRKQETPKIYIEGDLYMNDKSEIGTFKVKYESDSIKLDKYATLKIQGSSSIVYGKKNYTIKFYNDENCLDKFKVDFGWGRESKYVLKANWVDKTHSRNIVTARLAAQVQKKYNVLSNTPNNGLIDGFPVEVYLNNEFYGLYTLNIPKDEWLYGMDDKNKNHIIMVGEEYTQETLFKNLDIGKWQNQLGDNSLETQKKFLRLSDFIINSTDEEFKKHFDQYLNLDSSLNYYVLCNILNISDNVAKNLIFVTYNGKVWYPTLYDLDTSFGAYYNGTNLYEPNYIVPLENNTFFKRFNQLFSKEIADRYFELRKNILSEENIINEIDKFYSQIDQSSLEKEQEKWQDIPGYDITQMKDFIKQRLPYIDQLMRSRYPQEINTQKKKN